MNKITQKEYELALDRIEFLLPLVDDNTPSNDRNAVELSEMSDVVIAYEKEYFPIETPAVLKQVKSSLNGSRIPLHKKRTQFARV